jgi:hypothetical protein
MTVDRECGVCGGEYAATSMSRCADTNAVSTGGQTEEDAAIVRDYFNRRQVLEPLPKAQSSEMSGCSMRGIPAVGTQGTGRNLLG